MTEEMILEHMVPETTNRTVAVRKVAAARVDKEIQTRRDKQPIGVDERRSLKTLGTHLGVAGSSDALPHVPSMGLVTLDTDNFSNSQRFITAMALVAAQVKPKDMSEKQGRALNLLVQNLANFVYGNGGVDLDMEGEHIIKVKLPGAAAEAPVQPQTAGTLFFRPNFIAAPGSQASPPSELTEPPHLRQYRELHDKRNSQLRDQALDIYGEEDMVSTRSRPEGKKKQPRGKPAGAKKAVAKKPPAAAKEKKVRFLERLLATTEPAPPGGSLKTRSGKRVAREEKEAAVKRGRPPKAAPKPKPAAKKKEVEEEDEVLRLMMQRVYG